ncbi:MAG: RNA polymerase sigma factor [Patescibacteria group bacterium]
MAQRSITQELAVAENDSLRTFHMLYSQQDLLVRTTRFARRLVGGSSDDAEDIALAGYYKIAKKLTDTPGYIANWDYLGTFCFKTVRNLCVDLIRQESRLANTSIETSARTFEEPHNKGQRLAIEARIILDKALPKLPRTYRDPVVLVDLRHMAQQEAADRVGITLPAFKSRLYRGRQQLREELTKLGVDCELMTHWSNH